MLVRTIILWLIGLPITAILFIVVLISLALDRSGNAVHSIGALWCRVILRLSGVVVTVRGAENIPAGKPIILLSNHQGAFDIPALQGCLPLQFRWVAKKSLFSIPVIGWSMRFAGYIGIEREHGSKAYRSIVSAAKKIQAGTSVLVFPEGTRSVSGELLPFKRGAFMLAVKSGALVIPVAITGTRDIMKKHGLLITPHSVTITIGRPIETSGMDEKMLSDETRRMIEDILGITKNDKPEKMEKLVENRP
ncbi:MAG: 1-acyl-sn-glycerol-3-phosphate acyltransferase [Deltaproteobacteria bacterium]|nr:1-acyl-sn-glycerol-3-phosphate acyltransferase [Deltaproteobacteria bacterium]